MSTPHAMAPAPPLTTTVSVLVSFAVRGCSQAVGKVGIGLRVTATADDGIVEGLEVEGTWLLAVQWHPEDTAVTDPTQQRLFDALVERARD